MAKGQESPEDKLKKRLQEEAAQTASLQTKEKGTEADRTINETQRKEAMTKVKEKAAKHFPKEGDKDFVGPKYTPLVDRPGGLKYKPEINKLTIKLHSGTATDEEKHRYYLLTGTRARNIETD